MLTTKFYVHNIIPIEMTELVLWALQSTTIETKTPLLIVMPTFPSSSWKWNWEEPRENTRSKPILVSHLTYYARSDDGIDEVETGTSNGAGVFLLDFSNWLIFLIYQRLLLHYSILLENWLFFVITRLGKKRGKKGREKQGKGRGGGGGGKGNIVF